MLSFIEDAINSVLLEQRVLTPFIIELQKLASQQGFILGSVTIKRPFSRKNISPNQFLSGGGDGYHLFVSIGISESNFLNYLFKLTLPISTPPPPPPPPPVGNIVDFNEIQVKVKPTGEEYSSTFFVSSVGKDYPDVSQIFKNASTILKEKRNQIIDTVYQGLETLPPVATEEKCKRDISFVVDAIISDLGNSSSLEGWQSNLYTLETSRAYFDFDGTRRISNEEVPKTIEAFQTTKDLVIAEIGDFFTFYIQDLIQLVISGINLGLKWVNSQQIKYGIQRGRWIDGSNLIKANRDLIVNRVLNDLQSPPYSYEIPAGDKCKRDINFLLDAVIYDLRNLGNSESIRIARKYFEGSKLVISNEGTPSELTKTITAFTLTRDLAINAVKNKLPNESNLAEVKNELNPSLFLPGARQHEEGECASIGSTTYSLFQIVIGYLQNGAAWEDAPKRNLGLTETRLPGQSWSTAFSSIKRALAEVAKFPGKECMVRVGSGKFYEDNPLIIPQPKTAVVGDNLRTTTICPLNHGQDLFKVDSGTYLNYMVFEDNYLGGYGVLQTPSGSKEISATTTVFSLFPGHTIKDVPGRFKDAANLVRANRLYINTQVADYDTDSIVDAVIADLRINGNINAIAAGSVAVNNPTKITETKNLILSAIKNELPNSEANQTTGTDFNAIASGGSQYVDDLCANVQATASTLIDIIASIASGQPAPERNTGTLLLINQEWVQIQSIVGNVVNIASRGVGSTATRHISGSKCTQNAKAFRYAAAFKDGTNIFLSPYIQNCSNISVLGRTVLKTDGSGELDDSKTLAGGILVDGGVLANTTPIASMVMDAFTQIVSGSVGFHHKRDGYSQLVSVFQVFDDIGILCESGAYTSVTNSATNFGNTALKAVGFSANAFPFYKGSIASAANVNLEFNATPANIFSSSFAAQGNQTKVTLIVEADKINQFVTGQTITVSEHSVATANGTGLIITEVVASDRTISYLINSPLPGGGITPGGQTGSVTITSGRLVTRLGISGFTSVPLPNYIVKVTGASPRLDGIEYVVEESTTINQSGVCTITLQIPWEGTLPTPGTLVELRRPSTVNSSSHTFEFIGSGINYTALPENGGVTDPESQTVEVNSGKVYCSATDQDGNFTVGPFFNVDLKSGKVTFTGTVSLGVIDEIQLKNSPGVPIRQFSIDSNLDGNSGASHTRISTQKAVRDFVQGNLGNLFNKTSGTGGGSNSFAGQLVELDGNGFIGQSQLPPRSPFNIFTVANEAERLALTEINQGDYVVQSDTQVTYILKTILNGGASYPNNWAVLPSGVTSASSIVGVIDTANLGTGAANATTFLAGSKAYLPVAKSIKGEGAVTVGSDAVTPDDYPVNSKVGDITIGVNTTAFSQGQTSGSSSLGVAKFAYEDFQITDGIVSLRDEAVDLVEIAHIAANSVLGNDTSATGQVKALPLNDVVATVTNINVSFAEGSYVFTSNNITLGSTLYLTRGQTYKFNINTTGNPFQLALPNQTPYSTGLVGTNGTAVTNDSTKFIWSVPLNAPDNLRYQSSTTPSIGGVIALNGGAIASTEKGANNGVATLDSSGLIPVAQIPRSISRSAIALTSINLTTAENGLIVETTATDPITITLPNNLPAGFNCIVVQKGEGQITFTPESGATLLHPDSHTKTAKQYASATLYISTNSGTNAEYILSGNTVA